MREFSEQFFDLLLDLDANWRVTTVRSNYKDREVFIDIEHVGKQACCPKTFDLCGVYDLAPKRKWRHLDILDYKTYLVCRLPRVNNKQGKVITVKPPWGGSGVSFSSQFEEKVIDLLQATKNQTKTALLINCSFSMVNRIMHNSVERGMERRPEELEFTNLSIDEKSFKRNHHYVTVLSTLLSGVVIDVCENRTKQACSKLLSEVLKDKADNVQTVSVDMWKAYLESISDVLPNAKIVHDRFHLVKYLNQAMDKVRRREVKQHQELKNSRYALLKNQENLTEKQRIKFESIRAANYQVSKAWQIRENFKDTFHSNNMEEAVKLFCNWGAYVLGSNIKEMIKVAKIFNNHLKGVCNAMVESFSNAMAERLNGKIQEIKTVARGYRTFKNFRNAILFFHGGLQLKPLNLR